MKKISNISIAYFFYALGTIDYVSASYFNNDLTGVPFSPIIFGGIGSIFMFLHNSKIKESNNNVYEIFKFSLFAVLISDDIIDESELEYSSSILNTLENEFLLPTNPSKLEQEILNYDLNGIYDKIQNLETSIPYSTKLNILSSCAILCVMDGQIDKVEQESIYKISNILNISEIDMNNIFNASIASYIDFKNSDREKLQINDSEVNKVVDEKKAENKSNKNQIYVGIGVFAALTIFGIYSLFQVKIEESCDNFVDYLKNITAQENILVDFEGKIDKQARAYIALTFEDNYFQLSSDEQIKKHNEIFLGWDENLDNFRNENESYNKIEYFNTDNEHEDIVQVVTFYNEYLKNSKVYWDISINYYDAIEEHRVLLESFFYDWENSNQEKNQIQSNFNSEFTIRDNALIDTSDLSDNALELKSSSLIDFDNVANNICVEYNFDT